MTTIAAPRGGVNPLASRFGIIPALVLESESVSAQAKVTFARLWVRGFVANNRITKSNAALAAELGIDGRTLRRHLHELYATGYVVRMGDDGAQVRPLKLYREHPGEADPRTTLTPSPRTTLTGGDIYVESSFLDLPGPTPGANSDGEGIPWNHEGEPPWKSALKADAAATAKRTKEIGSQSRAKRLARASRRPKGEKAEDGAGKPPAGWTVGNLGHHFVDLYRQAYPHAARMSADALLGPKEWGILKTLVQRCIETGHDDAETWTRAIEAARSLIDHAFANRERFTRAFKLNSGLTLPVLLSFRDSIRADMAGVTHAGQSRLAAKTNKPHDPTVTIRKKGVL